MKATATSDPRNRVGRPSTQRFHTLIGNHSIADLARRTKLHRSYLYRILSGERVPSLGTLDDLCKVLRLDIDEFRSRLRQVTKAHAKKKGSR